MNRICYLTSNNFFHPFVGCSFSLIMTFKKHVEESCRNSLLIINFNVITDVLIAAYTIKLDFSDI